MRRSIEASPRPAGSAKPGDDASEGTMNTLRLAGDGKIEVVDDTGSVVDELQDRVLEYLLSHAIKPTVANYLGLSFFGDVNDPSELQGELAAEFEEVAEYLSDSEAIN